MSEKELKKSDHKPDHEPKKKIHCCLISVVGCVAIIIIIAVLILFFWLFNKKIWPLFLQAQRRTDIPTYINVTKDASAEIDVAKAKTGSYADSANEAVFAQGDVAATFPPSVYPFAKAISDWGKKTQDAANAKDMSKAPDEPDSFKMTLGVKDVSDAYDDVLNDIDGFKAFGDYAIAKKDQKTMLWIAARLHADEILLNALDNSDVSQGPSDVAYAATKYGDTCYWGRGHVMVFSNRKKKADCLKKLTGVIKPLREAAQNFWTSGKAEDAKNWTVAWDGVKNAGYPISTTGASFGDSNFPAPPAWTKFQDACKAKGGDFPAGLAMDHLPTSESGWICKFKGPKGGTCWDFQTNSGKQFAGGDGDCNHINLLPVSTYVTNPVPTEQPGSAGVEVPKVKKTAKPVETEAPTEAPTAQACEDCDSLSESCYQAWHSQLDACRAESLTPAHYSDPNWYNENCYAKIDGWQNECSQKRADCHQRNPGCSYNVGM